MSLLVSRRLALLFLVEVPDQIPPSLRQRLRYNCIEVCKKLTAYAPSRGLPFLLHDCMILRMRERGGFHSVPNPQATSISSADR
jgi:hypothetical protein